MHKLYLTLFLAFVFAKNTSAQSLAINTDGSTANASALLDLKSTTKGLLIPRLTSIEKTSIAAPANGLMVYDTDTKGYWYYNGVKWIDIINSDSSNWQKTGNHIYNKNSGRVGIANSNPLTKLDINGDVAIREKVLTLSNGTNNNVNTDSSSFIKIIGPSDDFSITGFTNGVDGKIVTLFNATNKVMTITPQSTFSLAANRINTGPGVVVVRDSGTISLQYSATLASWIIKGYSNASAESDGGTDYYGVVGTTLQAATSILLPMNEMSITFTPLDTIAFVNFSASGSNGSGCGQHGIQFLLYLNGDTVLPFHASIEDMAVGSEKLWNTAFEYPVKVNAHVLNTISVLWKINGGCTPVVIHPGVIYASGTGSFRALTVKAPHGKGTINVTDPGSNTGAAWYTYGNIINDPINQFIGTKNSHTLRFRTNNVERMILREDGDIGFGTTIVGTYLPSTKFEFASEDTKFDMVHRHAGGNTPGFNFFKSRGTLSSPTAVLSSSFLGKINFYGHDGTDFLEAATIICGVDGTVATNTLGTKLLFETRGSNTGSSTIERMRINSDGNIGIATGTPETKLVVNGGVSYNASLVTLNTAGVITLGIGNRSYFKLTSNQPTTAITLGFDVGLEVGQLLIVECTSTTAAGNGFQLVQGTSANVRFNETAGAVDGFDSNDIATFIWTGTTWLQISTRTN